MNLSKILTATALIITSISAISKTNNNYNTSYFKKFENTETKALNSIHPELKTRALEVKKIGKDIGLNVYIISGLRTIEEQKRLFLQGRDGNEGNIVTYQQCDINNAGKGSKHCWGAAFDVFIFKNNKIASINEYKNLANAVKKSDLNLESGCFWNGFVDCPHYQMSELLTYFTLNKKTKKIQYVKYSKPYISNDFIDVAKMKKAYELTKIEKEIAAQSIMFDLINASDSKTEDNLNNENLINPLSIIDKVTKEYTTLNTSFKKT